MLKKKLAKMWVKVKGEAHRTVSCPVMVGMVVFMG